MPMYRWVVDELARVAVNQVYLVQLGYVARNGLAAHGLSGFFHPMCLDLIGHGSELIVIDEAVEEVPQFMEVGSSIIAQFVNAEHLERVCGFDDVKGQAASPSRSLELDAVSLHLPLQALRVFSSEDFHQFCLGIGS